MPVDLSDADILDLPGEIVSGHPDRHVARVEVNGRVCYLKRQHRVGWRERLRNWRLGFGWVSKCGREAKVLAALEKAGFPHPECVAVGEREGRAFLLVAELGGVTELRDHLSDNPLSPDLGARVAELHAAGFTTPDLTAKHVFVSRSEARGRLAVTSPRFCGERSAALRGRVRGETFTRLGSATPGLKLNAPHPAAERGRPLPAKPGRGDSQEAPSPIVLIDWQSAELRRPSFAERTQCLAALHASLADEFASPRERLRFLREYLKVESVAPFVEMVRRIEIAAKKQAERRSIRDQRQREAPAQRLVWLAGEAVCATPEVAELWPTPAVCEPYYGSPLVLESRVELADGRPAVLLRQHTFAPLSRIVSKVRGRVWRSPGVTLGRILFHLERYGIPAPRLLAFGQLESSAESFVLFDPPRGVPLAEWLRHSHSADVKQQCESLLRKLHDAGCRLTSHADVFRVKAGRVSIADPRAVRLRRKLSARACRADFARLAHLFDHRG